MTRARKIVLVTPASIDALLANPNPRFVAAVIGKALTGLLQRQTDEEQNLNATVQHNGVGFTGADAHSATLTAKYFRRHGTLTDWQIEAWVKPRGNGHTRLSKYHAQLNQIAIEKQQSQLPLVVS